MSHAHPMTQDVESPGNISNPNSCLEATGACLLNQRKAESSGPIVIMHILGRLAKLLQGSLLAQCSGAKPVSRRKKFAKRLPFYSPKPSERQEPVMRTKRKHPLATCTHLHRNMGD